MNRKDAQISEEDIKNLLLLDKVQSEVVVKGIMKLLQLDKITAIYKKSSKQTPVDFVDSILSQLKIKYHLPAEDLRNIPQDGPFIVIANHPYGGIDGLILMSLLLKARPDFKVMVNYMLQQFPEIETNIIAVDPFAKQDINGMNIKGMKNALHLLMNEVPVGIFPAGEVSAFKWKKMRVSDKMWHPVVGKLITRSKVRVVPVYFSGNNSLLFNLLGMINPKLRTAKLPSELFNKTQTIQVRIGKPISTQTLKLFKDNDQLMRFLRAKTYSLGSSLDVKPFFTASLKKEKEGKEISSPVTSEILAREVLKVKGGNGLLADHNEFSVLLADATEIPNVLHEIARLREITFREVGEGTGNSFDTDEYDITYKHLFVWDNMNNCIVGAYRIGNGPELFAKYKKKGFYLNRLFKFNKEFNPVLKSSLELGRSFIVKEYQRSPYPLMLLWKGINEYIKDNPKVKYLIGPVSISNNYKKLSKEIMVNFILKHHFDETLAGSVTPRKKFKYAAHGETKSLAETEINDIRLIDSLISDIEPSHSKVPVLIKKYLSQNAKIIAFNVDPDFSNSLDGLLVLKLDEVPENTFKLVS